MSSRGTAISAYSPAFANGAKVYGANVASGSITSAHIADGTVVAADVAAGSITSAKLGAAAVTSAKLGAGAVTSAKLASNAVVKAKMRSSIISGTLATDGATVAVAHGLSAVPSVVVVTMKSTAAKLNQSASACVGEASASARTTANVYIAGSAGTGYQVYCLI